MVVIFCSDLYCETVAFLFSTCDYHGSWWTVWIQSGLKLCFWKSWWRQGMEEESFRGGQGEGDVVVFWNCTSGINKICLCELKRKKKSKRNERGFLCSKPDCSSVWEEHFVRFCLASDMVGHGHILVQPSKLLFLLSNSTAHSVSWGGET